MIRDAVNEAGASGGRALPSGGRRRSFAGRQKEVEIFFGEVEVSGGGGVVGKDTVVEGTFLLLEVEDFLFDGLPGDEFIDEDGVFLSDAVGAIGGLAFEGRIPPWVEVDDGIGGGEVEAGAAGAEGDEEDGDSSGLEGIADGFAVAGLAGESGVGDIGFVEFGGDELEHLGELGKDENASTGGDQLVEHFD